MVKAPSRCAQQRSRTRQAVVRDVPRAGSPEVPDTPLQSSQRSASAARVSNWVRSVAAWEAPEEPLAVRAATVRPLQTSTSRRAPYEQQALHTPLPPRRLALLGTAPVAVTADVTAADAVAASAPSCGRN